MSTFLQKHRNWVIALAVAVIAFMMSAYVVPEEEQVVIIRTGQPVGTVNTPNGTTGAGIYFRVPIIERVSAMHSSRSSTRCCVRNSAAGPSRPC